MTDIPFHKRSRRPFLLGLSFVTVGLAAYLRTLKSESDLLAAMPETIQNGVTAAAISKDSEHLCESFQPAWVAILNRASEKSNARLTAELAARSFADLAAEPKISEDLKYKCLMNSVKATAAADKNLRDGVLLRKMRQVTADQLAAVAIDPEVQLVYDSAVDRVKAHTAMIEDIKLQMKAMHVLTGQVIKQREKGLYEIIDSKGRAGLLQTTHSVFQRKGRFTITARNTKQIDVKLSESEGNFDSKWLVWEEGTGLKALENDLAAMRTELANLKKTVAANESKAKAANKRRLVQMRKAFETVAAEYDGLTGRSIQEMTAN